MYRAQDPIRAQSVQKDAIAAFETLCIQIEKPLYSYVRRLMNGSHDAEDIAQEALLRLFRAMQSGLRQRSPRSFAFSIAHNLAVDALRKNRRISVPELAPVRAADSATEQRLLREQIEHALAELPDNHRSALLLRDFGELSYAEIAETLGVQAGQVKIWIHRARQRLSTLLDRDGQYIGTQHIDVRTHRA